MLRKAKMVQRMSPSRDRIEVEVSRCFFLWSAEAVAGRGGVFSAGAVKIGCGLVIVQNSESVKSSHWVVKAKTGYVALLYSLASEQNTVHDSMIHIRKAATECCGLACV